MLPPPTPTDWLPRLRSSEILRVSWRLHSLEGWCWFFSKMGQKSRPGMEWHQLQKKRSLSVLAAAPTRPAVSTDNFYLVIQSLGQSRSLCRESVGASPWSYGDISVTLSMPREFLCTPFWLLQDVWLWIQNPLFYLAVLGLGIQFGLLSLNLALASSGQYFWEFFIGFRASIHEPLSHTTCHVPSKRPFPHVTNRYGVCHSCLRKSHLI